MLSFYLRQVAHHYAHFLGIRPCQTHSVLRFPHFGSRYHLHGFGNLLCILYTADFCEDFFPYCHFRLFLFCGLSRVVAGGFKCVDSFGQNLLVLITHHALLIDLIQHIGVLRAHIAQKVSLKR